MAPPGLLRLGAALLVMALASGCGSDPKADPDVPATRKPPAPTSGTPLELLFPLMDGYTYTYVAETVHGEEDLLARATRIGPFRGSLHFPSGTKDFEYRPDGVVLYSREWGPVYVLKMPIQKGNQWKGEHGGMVEIIDVDAPVDVPAGRFDGCVKTLETRGGDRPVKVQTTYCPGRGIVELAAASGRDMERAVLKSYGPPVDIGPDGIRRLP
jgi:hypothetical protein